MKTVQHLDRWMLTAKDALSSGGSLDQRVPGLVRWDVSGKCSRPIHFEYTARRSPSRVWRDYQRNADWRATMELEVRCRKCPECLKARARYWKMRAEQELSATSGRTWFGTMTATPHQHSMAYMRACHRLAALDIDMDALPPHEQFNERVRELGAEVTRWLKRVRKQSGAKLRYLLCVEAHKSGLPHWHILVHEAENSPVPERVLRKQWTLGFSKFNLVAQGEKRAAHYVTKYLTKSASSRMRASLGYGDQPSTETALGHRNALQFRDHDGRFCPPGQTCPAPKPSLTTPPSIPNPYPEMYSTTTVQRNGSLLNGTDEQRLPAASESTGGTGQTFKAAATQARERQFSEACE